MSEITDGWLRSHGFKWEDHPHGRHWLLWIGRAIPDSRRCGDSSDFGIEIAPRLMSDGKPSLFFRADYAGRYNRFLFCRQLNSADDLMRIIESELTAPCKIENPLTAQTVRKAAEYLMDFAQGPTDYATTQALADLKRRLQSFNAKSRTWGKSR